MNGNTVRETLENRLRSRVREIEDFPIAGVRFKDITPLLADGALFSEAINALARRFRGDGITHVAAVESRGFLFGAPVAHQLGAGLVPVRKAGKLPARTEQVEYALEYGTATLEVHADCWPAGARVVVVDDVLATGGTALAACHLAERTGATLVGLGFLMSLSFLPGESALSGRRVETLLRY